MKASWWASCSLGKGGVSHSEWYIIHNLRSVFTRMMCCNFLLHLTDNEVYKLSALWENSHVKYYHMLLSLTERTALSSSLLIKIYTIATLFSFTDNSILSYKYMVKNIKKYTLFFVFICNLLNSSVSSWRYTMMKKQTLLLGWEALTRISIFWFPVSNS